ncbi:MAG: arginine--tRNA ligase [Candidatus Woesearchaeota archaeon]
MKNYKLEVVKQIKEVFPEFIESSISIPPNSEMGDFAVPCFAYKQFKNPQEASHQLTNLFIEKNKGDLISEFRQVGAYVNIYLNKKNFMKNVIDSIDENFAKDEVKKNIVIDYSSPNVAKNMGLHNLRSTVIGQCLYNVYKYLGYNVIGVNHLGDWGTQFGKLIWALEHWSSFEELEEKGILFLNEMYVRFHEIAEKENLEKMESEAREWFKKIENNDPIAKKWWELFVKISLKDYDEIYKRLNVKFDYTTGESFYIKFLEETLKKLEDKKLTSISEGALVVEFDENEKMPPCLLTKSDGATLYGTRDIAAIMYRLKHFHADKLLYVVDISQELHFKQVFKVMEMFDETTKEKLEHIIFGRLSFADASMSTRKGNIVPLKEVLDKSKEKVLEIIKEKNPDLETKEDVAEIVGVGAIIFGDLIHDRLHNIVFEWDKILDFQGETAPYIQYTYARLKSILRKEKSKEYDVEKLNDELEYTILKKISLLKEVLETVVKQNKPSVLCKFLIELCQLANSYYVKVPILKEENEEIKNSRLFLIEKISEVIKISTNLINIKVPEEM